MTSIEIVLAASATMVLSGLPACLFSPRSAAGQRLTTLLMSIGSLLGLFGLALFFAQTTASSLRVPWYPPWGPFTVTLDAIGVVFLGPVFVVPALGSIFGLGYWKSSEHCENGRRLGVSYGLLAGSMALVVVARDSVLFLIAWELMALAAYFAATAEEDDPEVREAGWVYLIATHAGTLCLLAMFALWRHATGSFELAPVSGGPGLPSATAGAIFVLALAGFGFKAGLMPLHVWLPGAHANAPSHVSAVMSGVMLKMGIYGIVRMTALLPAPEGWWGGVLLGVGAFTGVAGIAFAVGQRDLKRLLAYSSIENVGIIAMGLGLALLGRSQGRPDWVVLGLGAALFHVWNHSLFKSLLFFSAGAIVHATHTRDMDRLGGLAKQMPRVMVLFVVGAVAICALPPLNGFASEWLLYAGLFRTLGAGGQEGLAAAAVACVALAAIGALSVACFVKLLGAVFLGLPRRPDVEPAHPMPASMLAPMTFLAAGCAIFGLYPVLAVPLLDAAAGAWAASSAPQASIETLAPLPWITALGLALVALGGALAAALKALPKTAAAKAGTWDCGYAQPTPRMQYTGSSMGQTLVSLFAFLLWPRSLAPDLRGVFSKAGFFRSIVPDTVLDRFMLPVIHAAGRFLPKIRIMQQGHIQLYVLYFLIVMIVLFLWGAHGVGA